MIDFTITQTLYTTHFNIKEQISVTYHLVKRYNFSKLVLRFHYRPKPSLCSTYPIYLLLYKKVS